MLSSCELSCWVSWVLCLCFLEFVESGFRLGWLRFGFWVSEVEVARVGVESGFDGLG